MPNFIPIGTTCRPCGVKILKLSPKLPKYQRMSSGHSIGNDQRYPYINAKKLLIYLYWFLGIIRMYVVVLHLASINVN